MLLIFVMAASCAFAQGEERVKCKTATLVAPIGDLQAEAPDIEAEAAAMYSLDLQQFVYEKNADKRVEPYSTTKLLTCWLALENLDPDQTVTASEAATQA